MKPRKLALKLTALGLVAITTSLLGFAGCGGVDNANPMPTVGDSGQDSTTNHGDSGGQKESGSTDAGGTTDTSLPDTGGCKSDSGACNSCYTDAQAAADPYNGCSSYTKNCVIFDPNRVPTHPSL
jgi:hypothetical protein